MPETKTVIVIDDDPDVLEATRSVLEGAGYEVETATGGEAGVERVRKGGIDVILLDVMMARDTEGFHVAQELKEDEATAGVPVIMLTAISQKTGFEFSPETDGGFMPAEAFLEKPVDPERLVATVEDVLNR
jgi:CheY-like chemotaxis protein